ncbi:hypothetical protein [uncultured Mediterranean phage uvMED]|nr:hypothetical protein [uncultured Mediterranean phage uvMED]
MPGHTAAHEKASNKKTTTGSYSRSRNQGGVKTTVKSNNNRTRIQDEKQKEFKKKQTKITYDANEFSGTGKTTRTKKERDLLRLDNLKIKEVPPGVPGSTVLNAFQKARQKNLERNVEYFKGLKSRGRLEEYELSDIGYKEYIEDRMSGKITASGNPGSATRGGRDDNEAPPTMLQEKNVGGRTLITEAPTSTEITEKEEAEKYDARKTKKRGRRRLIFQQGTSKDFTLSKPILLGV